MPPSSHGSIPCEYLDDQTESAKGFFEHNKVINTAKEVKFGNDNLSYLSSRKELRKHKSITNFKQSASDFGRNNIKVSFMNNGNGEEEESSDVEVLNDLDKYVEHMQVQDRALKRKTNLVKIMDPCNGNVLASIRDPKCRIIPYKDMEGIVDIQKIIQKHIDERKLPTFYKGEPALTFGD